MPTIDNQSTRTTSSSPVNDQPMAVEKPFSFTRRQIISIGVLGGFVLLLIFGVGIRAGEKRALRRQSMLEAQPTPTPIPPSPTAFPTLTPTFTPASPSDSSTRSRTGEREIPSSGTACERDVDCLSCFALPGTPIVNCDAGRCVNGVCVWEEGKAPPSKRHE